MLILCSLPQPSIADLPSARTDSKKATAFCRPARLQSGLILNIYEADGLNFPPIKKAEPDFAKTDFRIYFPVSRAVRLQLCRLQPDVDADGPAFRWYVSRESRSADVS